MGWQVLYTKYRRAITS